MSSSEIRVVGSVGAPVDVIHSLLEEVYRINRKEWFTFIECYPQLQLTDDDWLDFCSQKCGIELMEELIEFLEDNAPVGWRFGQMDDAWVYLKDE